MESDDSKTKAAERREPTFFLAGYQKTATTWLHHCFLEHPDIFVPPRDSTNFFDINFHRGQAWFESHFDAATNQSQRGDTTPTYMRFASTRNRMAQLYPHAKILVTLRNPIDRAFSHYWHEKKKRSVRYRFEDCLGNNVDIFEHWIASGFYSMHLKHLYTLYPSHQVQVLFYDDLVESPDQFLRSALRFLDVAEDFIPSVHRTKVNRAWFRPTWGEMIDNVRNGRPIRQSEYDRGIDPEFRRTLGIIYQDEIESLESLVKRDLAAWKQ